MLNFSNGLVYGGLAGKQNRRKSFAMEILKKSILRGCFREDLFTCMSFRFVLRQSKGKPPTLLEGPLDILINSKGASALGML